MRSIGCISDTNLKKKNRKVLIGMLVAGNRDIVEMLARINYLNPLMNTSSRIPLLRNMEIVVFAPNEVVIKVIVQNQYPLLIKYILLRLFSISSGLECQLSNYDEVLNCGR